MQHKQQWQQTTAWFGGTVAGVAFSPAFATDQLALAATPAGIYRSSDGGQQWVWSSQGISDPLVVAVGFAPLLANGGTLALAASQGGRLFRSSVGGAAWSEVMSWAGLGMISSFLFSPAFAHDQTLFVTTDAGVFRTQDGGQNWESSTFGLHDLQTLCLACAPDFASGESAHNELLWVGTAAGGFYRSRNAGRSWRDAGAGLPDDALACLAVSPTFAADQTLYVGTETAGLYCSTDGGATWALRHADLAAASATALAISPTGRLLLGTGAGLYGSDDQGQTWTLATGGDFITTALAVAADGTVLAGTLHSGVYRSTDGGRSWQSANAGLIAHTPPLVARGTDGTILALDEQGWLAAYPPADEAVVLNDAATIGPLTAYAALALAPNPLLLAAAADGRLWQTSGQAEQGSWAAVASAPAERVFTRLASARPATAHPVLYLADQTGLLYRWAGSAELLALNPDVLWVGETLLDLALAPQDGAGQALVVVSAKPEVSGHYRLQLWESSDGGQQWQPLAALVSEIPAVALAWPLDPAEQALFVATRHRVIKLFYQGETPVLASTQSFLDDTLNITALTPSPTFASDGTLWAATTRGVYQSVDRGATWQPLGNGLAERSVVAILPPTADLPLQAVTLGGAVWSLGENNKRADR